MSELKSYITDEEFKNLKIHIVNYKPSSYIIVRFELPFQLPLDENGGIYSKKFRKGLKTKHIFGKSGNSDIEKVHSNVDIINILVEPLTKVNEDYLISKAIDESLVFLNNIIKVLITRFKYENFILINRFDLPVGIPVWISNKSNFKEKDFSASLLVNIHFNEIRRSYDLLSAAERNELIGRLELAESNPFFDQAVLFSEGTNLLKSGDFNSGFLKIHSCTERLMYGMVKEKFIKENKPHEKIEKIAQIPYKNILVQHLGPYLSNGGLLFDIDNNNSIAYEYWENVYQIRNNIVHAGHRATENESRKAHEILWKLNKSVIVTMKSLGHPDIDKYLTDSQQDLDEGYIGF
ncbi:hypothetical protein [Vagococcus lutrae]|uniref:Apea-like HEPN domain-containing protein n=1 Tax=Vagococcus lutrae LBD1 TaxID=1408226 RepID=V6Q6F7_9ENTE|nr:hypothetical protein [Vagococcus lutrae]EST90240.1 hypothetical protein T233_00806 [Vagococcus lutrae LBD1]NKZ27697.1 hypothetical protein [Vagococcus lutrae]